MCAEAPSRAAVAGFPSGWRVPLVSCLALVLVAGCASRRPFPTPDPDGPIYDVATGVAISSDSLLRVVSRADVVLLGELHDNGEHHALQAWTIERLVARGRRPAVVFEQLDLEKQDAVDGFLAGPQRGDAEAFAAAVQWESSGWPAFELYRPIFEVALAAGLPIRAANLSRARLGRPPHDAARPHGARQRPGAGGARCPAMAPLPAALRERMAAEIAESHCGYARPAHVDAMVEAQRRRDATMADVVGESADGGGAVVIAGFGHVRRDYGIPLYLRDRRPDLVTVSVAFVEEREGASGMAAYREGFDAPELPFDYVWITPGRERPDPCEEFRAQLERMKARR